MAPGEFSVKDLSNDVEHQVLYTQRLEKLVEIGYLEGRSTKSFRFLLKVNGSRNNTITVHIDTQRGGKIKKTIPIHLAASCKNATTDCCFLRWKKA